MAIAQMTLGCDVVTHLKLLQHKNEDGDRRDRTIGYDGVKILTPESPTGSTRPQVGRLGRRYLPDAELPSQTRQM